jgi:L-malate glycosyltransferase
VRDKINILFLTVQLETIGGSERLIYNLASRLDRNLFSPSVAWLDGKGVLKEFTELGIPLWHIPKTKRVDISTMKKLSEIIALNNIHIVNAHHFMPMLYAFYGSKVGNKRKLFYTEHSQWEVQQIPWKWQQVGSYLLNRSDGAIGVNQAVSRELRNKFNLPQEKVFSVLNGVDTEAYRKPKNKTAIRAGLGLSDDDKVIGIVANFKKVKNHIFLLRAFQQLRNENNKVRLVMVGESYENDPENSEPEIRRFVKKHELDNDVLFLGYRTDVPDILSILDVFCLTSFKEGLPISLIEAMAAGLPIVGTDVEGIKDVIRSEGNGFKVRVGDTSGLKSAINNVLTDQDLKRKFGKESGKLAIDNYSLVRCIRHYEDLFSRSVN